MTVLHTSLFLVAASYTPVSAMSRLTQSIHVFFGLVLRGVPGGAHVRSESNFQSIFFVFIYFFSYLFQKKMEFFNERYIIIFFWNGCK